MQWEKALVILGWLVLGQEGKTGDKGSGEEAAFFEVTN